MEQNIETRNKPIHVSSIIFDKGAKNKQWRMEILFNKQCWKNRIATCNWMKENPYLISYTKISQKWIKDLNVRHKIIKLLEENIVSKLLDISLGDDFWIWYQKQSQKKKK